MSQVFSSQPYKGTRDFYPNDLKKRNYIFQTWRKVLVANGFEEYETSLLENAELYIAKSGEELGGSQLYNFHDKGDRFVALRPEQTPSLARLVANKFGELRMPLRWFSIPNCFRYEKPQKGRLREHWQLNADIIGLGKGYAELEIMNLLGELFKAFGANENHFKIMFNHRQVLDTWLDKAGLGENKKLVYGVLDDWFKKSVEENIQELKNPAGEGVGINSDELIQLVVDLTKKEGKAWEMYLDIAKNFPEVKLILEQMEGIQPGIEYDFNPCIIRGIAYYTGVVLEAFDKNPSNPRALFGGGRYDDLMSLFGQEATAIGFGFGDVTMHEFLENWGLYPDFESENNRVGIMPFSEGDLIKVYREILPKLRSEGKSFDIDYDFERNEQKRWIGLKKRGCEEIIKMR